MNPAAANAEMIAFSCPHCAAQLMVPASMAGIRGPCPTCSQTIEAPQQQHASEEAQPKAEVLPPVRKQTERHHEAAWAQGYRERIRRRRAQGMKPSLFERSGFRRIRVALTICSLAAIFFGLHTLKKRRWIWSKPAVANAAAPEQNSPAATAAQLAPASASSIPDTGSGFAANQSRP